MYCEQCGGQFKRVENDFCPYCGAQAPAITGAARSDRNLANNNNVKQAKVKAILLANSNIFSPATDSTFIVKIDGGKYEIKLVMCEVDMESEISIPYGSHTATLEFYSYTDTALLEPDIDPHNNINFTLDESHNVVFTINAGTLLKPKRMTVKYV